VALAAARKVSTSARLERLMELLPEMLAESMYSGPVGRKQPLFTEGDLAELLKPLFV
jgi:hypothetical protein